MLMALVPNWQICLQLFMQTIPNLRKIESAANADCIPQASSTHISNHYDIKKKPPFPPKQSPSQCNFPNQVKKQPLLG